MSGRLKKFLLLLLAVGLLLGVGQVQKLLNRDRDQLGLTRVEVLDNAPPVLAFTTVALGGFRGLIANALWIRASDLQDEDKFFEMAQLADWITKLEPHFAQVWVVQAWNMTYNISIKFKDFADRWRWVERGVELLRDEGLRYNPNETLLYRELGWFYKDKMGTVTDDANIYYKQQWANEMAEVFGKLRKPDWGELTNPQTDDARRRVKLLRDKYRMDTKFMREVDERYGPLEWRLPEAHAIYWAAVGLARAKENPTKVNSNEVSQLRRLIYQSMLLSFQRGRLEANPYERTFEFSPNLDIIPKVNAAYEEQMDEDPALREMTSRARRHFLLEAIYLLYINNRLPEARQWFRFVGQNYPNDPFIPSIPDSLPGKITLDQFVVAHAQQSVNEISPDGVKASLEGILATAFRSLALGDEDRATGLRLLARQVWTAYQNKVTSTKRLEAMGLPPLDEIEKRVLERLLDPQKGFPFEMRAALRTALRMPAETAPASGATNAPAISPKQ